MRVENGEHVQHKLFVPGGSCRILDGPRILSLSKALTGRIKDTDLTVTVGAIANISATCDWGTKKKRKENEQPALTGSIDIAQEHT